MQHTSPFCTDHYSSQWTDGAYCKEHTSSRSSTIFCFLSDSLLTTDLRTYKWVRDCITCTLIPFLLQQFHEQIEIYCAVEVNYISFSILRI